MLPRFAFLSFECGGTNVDWQGSDRGESVFRHKVLP